MRILRDPQYTRPEDRGASAAIGNFDGVHRGHRHVIDLARRPGVALGVVTFEPHPREYFAPDAPPFRLMNAEARANRLEKLGIDRLYELNFNRALSSLSPEGFAGIDALSEGEAATAVTPTASAWLSPGGSYRVEAAPGKTSGSMSSQSPSQPKIGWPSCRDRA